MQQLSIIGEDARVGRQGVGPVLESNTPGPGSGEGDHCRVQSPEWRSHWLRIAGSLQADQGQMYVNNIFSQGN